MEHGCSDWTKRKGKNELLYQKHQSHYIYIMQDNRLLKDTSEQRVWHMTDHVQRTRCPYISLPSKHQKWSHVVDTMLLWLQLSTTPKMRTKILNVKATNTAQLNSKHQLHYR